MRLKRLIAVGVATAAVAGSVGAVSAWAGAQSAPPATQYSVDPTELPLRALGARHKLYIGTAVSMDALNDASDPTYRQMVAEQFSTVTAENVMKWSELEATRGTYNWGPADQLMEFARKNHQMVRGHVLVWHNQLPTWLTEGVASGAISKAELESLLENHIKTVVGRYKGKIAHWDVVNEAASDPWEPLPIHYGGAPGSSKNFWIDNLGPSYIEKAFRWARSADPKALLFYNDYNIDAFGDGGPGDKTQFVFDMVKSLRAKGVPIDGVGSQGHLGTQYGNYDTLQVAAALEKFASLGVATALTEVDVRSQLTEGVNADLADPSRGNPELNPRLQASAGNFSILMQACLSSRKCLSYTVWGFTDKYSWVPTWFVDNNDQDGDGDTTEPLEDFATLYDREYNPKRAYNVVRGDLIFSGAPYVLPRVPQSPYRGR